MRVRANHVSIEVEDTHPGSDRPVVMLIMGLGMQLVAWPARLVDALVEAGYRVVRHDNRDVGLSEHLDHLGAPNLIWESLKHRLGLGVKHPYSLRDMALDALGVLDALRIERAHVVGASMGGMIAQRVAIEAPSRVTSLTSIMSSSGERSLPKPKAHVLRALMARPASRETGRVLDHYVRLFRLIGSPGFPTDEQLLRERITLSTARGYHPEGTVRQMLAVAADSSRAVELRRINAPTLVIHGRDDPLVPHPHGEDTARRVPGSRLMSIAGMGHDLPLGVLDLITPEMLAHFRAAAPQPAGAGAGAGAGA